MNSRAPRVPFESREAAEYLSPGREPWVWSTEIKHPESKLFSSYRDFEEWQEHNGSFEQLEACESIESSAHWAIEPLQKIPRAAIDQ